MERDFFTPQNFSRVEKRAGGSPAWPLPSTGSDHHRERERASRGVCAQGTDRPGHGTNAAACKQEHHQACSQVDPCGTEYKEHTGKREGEILGWAGVSAFHHPVTGSRRDTDRQIEGQRHRIKAWDLLMGSGMPVTACFDGIKNDHCLCKWGAGKGVGQQTEERLEGQGSASRLGQLNPGPGQSP